MKSLEQKATELLEVRAMLRELEALKKTLENEFKGLTKNGPLVLADGRTVQTIVSHGKRLNYDALKSDGVYENYLKDSTTKKLEIK